MSVGDAAEVAGAADRMVRAYATGTSISGGAPATTCLIVGIAVGTSLLSSTVGDGTSVGTGISVGDVTGAELRCADSGGPDCGGPDSGGPESGGPDTGRAEAEA